MKECAKSCVFREYRHVISLGNTFVQHEHDDESEFSKLSGFYSVSFVCDQIQSMMNSLRLIETSLPFPSLFLTKQNICLLCFGVILNEGKSDAGSLESESYYCNSERSLNELRQNLELQTIQQMCRSPESDICRIDINLEYKSGPFCFDIRDLPSDITENILFQVFKETLLKDIGKRDAKVELPVDVNSKEWRQNVAKTLFTLIIDRTKDIATRFKEICRETWEDLRDVCSNLEDYKKLCHQNSMSECKYIQKTFLI